MAQVAELANETTESVHRLFAEKVPAVMMKYRLSTYLGKGHTSRVVKGIPIYLKRSNAEVAIKLLGSRSSNEAIMEEIRILKRLKGLPNIVEYIEHFENGPYTALVTSYIKTEPLKNIYQCYSAADVQTYMRNLLLGLHSIKSHGFFHGDIKPGNFLVSKKLDKFAIIDFGMSQNHYTQLRARGTRGFKAPEVLLKHSCGTSALDIWSAGILFLTLLSGVYPFFVEKGGSAFREMCVIFGAAEVLSVGKALNNGTFMQECLQGMEDQTPLDLHKLCFYFRNYDAIVAKHEAGKKCWNCKQLTLFCLCQYPHVNQGGMQIAQQLDVFPPSTYDLLKKMLYLIPQKRITVEEALNHPFFSENLPNNQPYLKSIYRPFRNGVLFALLDPSDDANSTDTTTESSCTTKPGYKK